MLVALMTILFLGGGSTNAVLTYVADTKPVVKEVVTDELRQKEALATLKAMKAEQKSYQKLAKATVKDVKAGISEDPGADFDPVWEQFYEARRASDERMVNLRFELRDQLTRDEWQSVFAEDGRN